MSRCRHNGMSVGPPIECDRRKEVAGKVASILAAIKNVPRPSVALSDDDDFLEKLGMDSIDTVELIVQLDAVFAIGFGHDPDDLDSLAAFGHLVDLVLERGSTGVAGDGDGAVDAVV